MNRPNFGDEYVRVTRDDTWQMIGVSMMDHCIQSVTLQVADLQRSLQFYVDLVGFKVLDQADNVAHLGVPGRTEPLVTLSARSGARRKPPRTTGLYHIAVLFPNRGELARVFRRLTSAQWPFQGYSDHGVSEALYLPDPDGNGIELYADRPQSAWQVVGGEVQMTTLPLDVDDLMSEAERFPVDTGGETLPEGTIIGHVHLHVSDLEAAERFYVELLGFDVMLRGYPGALFIASSGYHHHLGLNVWAGVGAPPPPADAVGLLSFSLRPPNGQKLEDIVQRLQQSGYAVDESKRGWVTRDPHGIEVVIA